MRWFLPAMRMLNLCGVALLRSAPGRGVSRPPHAASRDCRTAHPSSGRIWVGVALNSPSLFAHLIAARYAAKPFHMRA